MSESTRIPEWPGWCRLPFVESWAYWIAPALPDMDRVKGMEEAIKREFADELNEDAGKIDLNEAFAEARGYADTWRAWKGRFQARDYTEALNEWLVAQFFQIADRRPIRQREYTRGSRVYLPLDKVRRHVAKPWRPASRRPEDAGIVKRHTELDERIVNQCIGKAERSLFHYKALCEVVRILNDAQQQLSGALLNWNVNGNAPHKRGRPPLHEFHVRDGLICATVEDLVARGIQATRNDVSPSRSACDVAAEAFGMSYRRVLSIRRERRLRLKTRGFM